MDLNLAAMYGTPGAEDQIEEAEKTAQAELFAKLAADEGIDLNQLDDNQIQELWDATFTGEEKTAGAEEYVEEPEKTAAEIEFEEEKGFQEKVAEADYLGRIMAHSYVQELGEIGDHMDKEAGYDGDEDMDKEAVSRMLKARAKLERAKRTVGSKAREIGSRYGELLTGSKAKDLGGKREQALSVARRAKALGGKRAGEIQEGATKRVRGLTKAETKERKKVLGARLGTGAAALGTAGTAYGLSKKSSADTLNELAFDLALDKVAEAGWDAEECAERIGSVFTLGMFDEENTKIAHAEDVDGAIEIRSLEMLESAGYDVDWG